MLCCFSGGATGTKGRSLSDDGGGQPPRPQSEATPPQLPTAASQPPATVPAGAGRPVPYGAAAADQAPGERSAPPSPVGWDRGGASFVELCEVRRQRPQVGGDARTRTHARFSQRSTPLPTRHAAAAAWASDVGRAQQRRLG